MKQHVAIVEERIVEILKKLFMVSIISEFIWHVNKQNVVTIVKTTTI